MSYADTSSLPVFFGNESGVLFGRLEESKGRDKSIVKSFSKMWLYRKQHFCQKKIFQLILELMSA